MMVYGGQATNISAGNFFHHIGLGKMMVHLLYIQYHLIREFIKRN